jgi:replicative DNA helicase
MTDYPEKINKFTQRRTLTGINSPGMAAGKIPPQAPDLEEAVLGALMLEKNALIGVLEVLKPESFYKDAHQCIYRAIKTLFEKSQPIDILTVTEELRKNGELEIAGGAYFVTQLTSRVSSAANIEYHAHIIAEKFIQRELIRISTEIQKEAFEDSTDVFELLDKAESMLFSIAEGNIKRNYTGIQELLAKAIEQIESVKNHEDGLTGVPTGFTKLDRITSGWQKSDLMILAARPGMGKTAFVLSIARNAAVDFKKPVVIFSLEMSNLQLVNRLISGEAELDQEKLKTGKLANYEWEQLNSKIGRLGEAPLFIDDTPALSVFELRAKCRRLKAQHDIQLIIIDYLQLMKGEEGKNNGNREQEISYISRSLKNLAKELNVPVIALSQLSREVEKRGGTKRPLLSDLRESGSIEQDADMVLFIYRPEYYQITEDEDGNSTAGMAEIIIAKHRNGALDDVKVRFVAKFAKFLDLDEFQPADRVPDFSNGTITFSSKMNEMDDDVPF